MRTVLASIALIAVIALLLVPVAMVWCGFMPGLPVWSRIVLVCGGVIIARLVRPFSILLGKDLKII